MPARYVVAVAAGIGASDVGFLLDDAVIESAGRERRAAIRRLTRAHVKHGTVPSSTGTTSSTNRNSSRPGISWSPLWRSTHRRRRVAGGPTRPAPPLRAPFRPSASCDAPPRSRGGPVGPSGETFGQEAQPRANETRSQPAHGARSHRRGHTPATPPHKAAHTATGGASGRNRSRSPVRVADVGLNGARRRPSRK